MSAPRKLAVYALALAAVLGVSMAVGAAAEPTGISNAEPKEEHVGAMGDEMVPGLAAADTEFRLVPDTDTVIAGNQTPYAFRIQGEEAVVTRFDVEHTKRMHLIVVRRDFAGFQHLHPEMDPDGRWHTDLTIADPGAYRVFADFVVDEEKQTLATDLFVGGDFRPEPLPAPARTADAGDGYTVEISGRPVVGEESVLEFVIRHNGAVVHRVPEYLGARGHLVALRDGDLAYLHVHAEEDALAFEASFPTPGAYRLFLQFRHGGAVRTAAFTIAAEESR
jgi:hypothetical protein